MIMYAPSRGADERKQRSVQRYGLGIKMTTDLLLLASRARRRLGWQDSISSSSVSHEVLHPERESRFRPAYCLQDELQKAKGTLHDVDLSKELLSVASGRRWTGATTHTHLQKIYLRGDRLLSPKGSKLVGNPRWKPRHDQNVATYTRAALRSSFIGSHFFGDWLRDDVATHLLAEIYGTPISVEHDNWVDTEFYLKVFRQSYDQLQWAYFDELHIFDDIHQNEHKAARLHVLRDRMRQLIGTRAGAGKIFYLMRGKSGEQRTIVNEPDLVNSLSKAGVEIISTEQDSALTNLKIMIDCAMVIGLGGSQLSHAIYSLGSGGSVLAILRPSYFYNPHYDWSSALGMKYGLMFADEVSGGYHINIDRLMKTIDLVLE